MLYRTFKRLAVTCAAIIALGSAAASAATISVTGGTGATGISIGPNATNQAIAVEFSLAQGLANYAITANAFCVNCNAGFWLHKGIIGPTALIGESISAMGITGTVDQTAFPTFTGQLLTAGNYFLIFSVTSGTGGWLTAAPPVLIEDGGTVGFSYQATTVPILAYKAPFQIIASRNALPEFSVTGTTGGDGGVAPIPLPAGGWMLVGGLAALGGLARRRRSRSA